jgi:hypothetical protein
MLRVVGFCVNLYAAGLVLHHFSFTLNLWRSPLARKVALWVFASVVAIELVILVPSYQRRRQELIAEQAVVVARVDQQLVQRELNAYVLRIAGLVLLISIVVTGTAMSAVSLTIIQPLLKFYPLGISL